MNRSADCIGLFTLFATAAGGKGQAVASGYRPQHMLHANYQSSGLHEYEGTQLLGPGESAIAKVWFITPEVYPACLWSGRAVSVLEGSRVVGTLQVREVLNPILRCEPSAFVTKWVAPRV